MRTKRKPTVTAAPALVHRIRPRLLQDPVRVFVVGCGGNGSEIVSGLPLLHQALLAYGHPGGLDVELVDGDRVSETNTVRQTFSRADVGHHKATVLINRVNAFYGLRWHALPRHLVYSRSKQLAADIIIGCVDSRRAREAIWRVMQASPRVAYWLDLGNDAAHGQFVLGENLGPRNVGTLRAEDFVKGKRRIEPIDRPRRLPCVAELYPEMIDAAADQGDTAPSCSAVEALERQEPFVNRTLASHALAMLARLFRYGELAYHGGFVNLQTGRLVPIPVSPEYWARTMGAGRKSA